MPFPRALWPFLRPVLWLGLIFLYMLVGGAIFQAIESTEHYEWIYIDSCLFAMSVFTTTGYGYKSPVTRLGKTLTVFYAIIGIPLFLKYVEVFGTILNSLYRLIVSRICARRTPRAASALKLLIAIIVLVIYHPLSALWHLRGNDWNFLDSMYFIFISVSTIGFGDMVYTADSIFNETDSATANLILSMIVLYIGYAFLGGVVVAAWDLIGCYRPAHPSAQLSGFPIAADHEFQNPLQGQEMSLVFNEPGTPATIEATVA